MGDEDDGVTDALEWAKRVTAEAERREHDRAVRAAGGGIGVPDGWEATKAGFLAEVAERDAQVRGVLVERVAAALAERLEGEFLDPADVESMSRAAGVAVDVLAEFLNPALVVRPSSGPWVSWGGDGVGP